MYIHSAAPSRAAALSRHSERTSGPKERCWVSHQPAGCWISLQNIVESQLAAFWSHRYVPLLARARAIISLAESRSASQSRSGNGAECWTGRSPRRRPACHCYRHTVSMVAAAGHGDGMQLLCTLIPSSAGPSTAALTQPAGSAENPPTANLP